MVTTLVRMLRPHASALSASAISSTPSTIGASSVSCAQKATPATAAAGATALGIKDAWRGALLTDAITIDLAKIVR